MKKMMTGSLLVSTLALWSALANAVSPPEARVPELKTTPKIDGKLDDPCWTNAVRLSDFFIHKDAEGKQTKDTTVLLGRDDQFLYIAFDCVNPNMRFLDQHGIRYDDQNVFRDDSVEVFITRQGLNRYFHYALNYANVKADRRIIIGGGRDLSWSYPWITATEQTEKGWTAELAIPLEVINSKEPGEVRINFLRNKTNVELDMMGAKNSESREHQFWAPVKKNAHEPESFGVATGLRDENMAPAPFLVKVDDLEIGELNIADDNFSFDVNAALLGVTPVAGNAIVEIVEKTDDDQEKIIVAKDIQLPTRCRQVVSLNVPVNDFSAKRLLFRLKDKATGMKLDERKLPSQGSLIKEAYPELSYYSSEKELRVKAILGLSKETLKTMRLGLFAPDDKVVARTERPTVETILSTKADILKPGVNSFTLKLTRSDGKVFGEKKVLVTCLRPGKENESKVDHFRRIALFKGKPYFPFGMYDGGGFSSQPIVMDAYIKSLQSAGMNTIITLGESYDETLNVDDYGKKIAALAEAGINIIAWANINRPSQVGIEKFDTQEGKRQCIRDNYENGLESRIVRCADILKDQPNFLSWYGLDEPNLGDWKTRLYVEERFWSIIKKADPYHVVFGLYARTIPRVPEATDFFDVLGYDIYTFPNWNRSHSRICDAMAALTAQLDNRAAENRQPIWVVPQPESLDPERCPRPLSGQEQRCQTYTAMIYGAKGILYFHYSLANTEEAWKTLRILGKETTVLAPALLNDPVKQNVTYASDSYDAARWQVPPAPFRLFRFPDGGLMALAVNGKNYPVDISVKINGLSGARRMFGDKISFDVQESEFKDTLEAYGTRTYVLESSPSSEDAIEVSISTTPHPELAKPIPSNESLLNEAKTRKNLVLNPSFEMRKIPGRPDFHMPYRVVRCNEAVGVDYSLDDDNPKFGAVSLRVNQPEGYGWGGVFGFLATPKSGDKSYVFSFYAKASRDDTRLWVGLPKGKRSWQTQVFTLSTEWKRYSMPCHSPGGKFLLQITEHNDLSRSYTVWLDGIQLEEGETPTEFSEK